MTTKQSLTRKQSLIRRSVAVLSAASLAVAWAVGISIPASAAPAKALDIVSVTNTANPGLGLLVQGQEFAVEVRVVNNSGRPTTVSEETRIALTASVGDLGPESNTTAVIAPGGSSATFSKLTYEPFDNDVVLTVSVESGAELVEDTISVDFALTATDRDATPKTALVVTDGACVAPTEEVPICGQLLLPNGANNGPDGRSDVVLSIGSCDGLGPCRTVGDITALVATGTVNIEGLYDKTAPATLVVACDKVLCGGTGVPKLPLIYTFDDNGPLDQTAPPCPRKGIIGSDQKACVDYVSSTRSDGDLYLHLLFARDMRGSCC
jgi:hypothetical protein